MSKERLEEIKEQVEISNTHDDNPNGYWYKNIWWLIEQAERVQELEDRHYRQELIDEHIERLEQQNKRYREDIQEAMELNHDENFNYDVDKVLLKALESESG